MREALVDNSGFADYEAHDMYENPDDVLVRREGQGRAAERAHKESECAALGPDLDTLGETTYGICPNENAYWRNVPANVWNYRLGGYQVLKKWLSYRERKVLGRSLNVDEVGHFSELARRVASILLSTLPSDSSLKG